MKIAVYSDIHLEFSNFAPPQLDADVIVLAGDIGKGQQGIEWAQEYFEQPVIYVFGNHEFYKGHFPRTLLKCRKANNSENVFILEQNAMVLKGVRFLGCILWTDFRITADPYSSMQLAEFEMNDYRVIRTGDSYRKLRARDTVGAYHQSLIWLKSQLAKPFDGRTIVVTHHAPHPDCLNRERYGLHLNGAYASDLSELVMAYQPELWIHGHTHNKVDFQLGATRIISNPRGYVSAGEETGFDPNLVVDL